MEKDTETKHFWKSVVIEEYYTKEDGDVYWNWRFAGTEEEVKRKSSRQIREEWEKENGQKWPKDSKTGQNQDVSHKTPKADGGTDDLSNIEPKPHDQHIQDHMNNGDFKRWGDRSNEGGK